MKLYTLLLFAVLAAVAAFAAVNWSTFTAPTTLSLVFTSVDAPLGVIMLAAVALLTVVFLLYLAYMQATVLVESRRHARALDESRTLADQAEASRFTELRQLLQSEMAAMADRGEQSKAEVLGRIDRAETALRAAYEQGGNTLAACIGELEDRVQRMTGS